MGRRSSTRNYSGNGFIELPQRGPGVKFTIDKIKSHVALS